MKAESLRQWLWAALAGYLMGTGAMIGFGLVYVCYSLGVSTFGKHPNFWVVFFVGFGILVLGTTAVAGFAQVYAGCVILQRQSWAKKIGLAMLGIHVLLVLCSIPYFLKYAH